MAEEKEDCLQTYWKVIEFLKRNEVKGGWQNLIIRSVDLTTKLGEIIYQCEKMQNKEKKTIRPEDNKILRAFKYVEPFEIKVVIIGTSPAATESIANGLAFSSDRNERSLRAEQAIPKVHQALRRAKILEDGADYHCGHKQWAKKGVLLLNAALTITEAATNESSHDIESHCNMWKEFLQELLFEWIIKTSIGYRHTLFVMLWGATPRPNMINYAERVWSKVYENRNLYEDSKKDIRKLSTHHPTFPSGRNNNFLVEATDHFKIINERYPGIFNLKPVVSVDKLTEDTKNKLSLDAKSDN